MEMEKQITYLIWKTGVIFLKQIKINGGGVWGGGIAPSPGTTS